MEEDVPSPLLYQTAPPPEHLELVIPALGASHDGSIADDNYEMYEEENNKYTLSEKFVCAIALKVCLTGII
jgi:hypothetical protein